MELAFAMTIPVAVITIVKHIRADLIFFITLSLFFEFWMASGIRFASIFRLQTAQK